MDFSEHIIVSAAGSAAIYAGTGDLPSAAAFSVMGVFIDLDHFLDYFRETGFNTRAQEFLDYFWQGKPKHLWLFLHAWEWLALGFSLALLLEAPAWVHWGLLGWLMHLVIDDRVNRMHPLTYFFSYRLLHRFDARSCYADKHED